MINGDACAPAHHNSSQTGEVSRKELATLNKLKELTSEIKPS